MIYRGSMELFLVTPLRDAECVFPIDDHLLKSVNTRLKIESVLLCATGNRRTIDAVSLSLFLLCQTEISSPTGFFKPRKIRQEFCSKRMVATVTLGMIAQFLSYHQLVALTPS